MATGTSMKNMVAIIPARGGSKGLPRKNLRELGGLPLIAWTIKAAKECPLIDSVIVTSDDPEILSVSAQYGADELIVRPSQLATDSASSIEAIAHALDNTSESTNFIFMGRGPSFPIALEGALKLKEISYIHAEGYAGGELKHGPIALIDEDMPVVVLAPQSRHYDKIASNLQQVRARDGRVIAVVTAGDHALDAMVDERIEIPAVHESLLPFVTTVPLQFLAYDIADMKGTDVDQPRNLAKSVTVE
jgi:glucosamine 6-phosphate synthetase-like amidotransferase/phosphosugar isomerase protein